MMLLSLYITLALSFFSKGLWAQLSGTAKSNCIGDINALRTLHQNTPNLAWSDALASGAQTWADHLANTVGPLVHASANERDGAGENLYYSIFRYRYALCADALLAWYKEEANYNYETGNSKNRQPIGHFTQIVWKGTTQFGVGIATKVDGEHKMTFIVARFSPAGNVENHYTNNVELRKPGAVTPNIHQLEYSVCANYEPSAWCSYFLGNADALNLYGGCSYSGVQAGCYRTCTGC